MVLGARRTVLLTASLVLLAGGCTFDPALDGGDYPPCGEDGQCLEGCFCLAGQVCVPAQEGLDSRACAECLADSDCRHGCRCEEFRCRPPVSTQYGDYCRSGPQCDENNPCDHGCRCDDFQCVPPVETDYPDYCSNGAPECDGFHPCPYEKCTCEDFHCQPDIETTYPDYCTLGPPECDDFHPCPYEKCTCEDFHCLPDIQTSYPDYCTLGPPECERDSECAFGCRCENFTCQPRVGFGNRDCHAATATCSDDGDCRLGCECEAGTCRPLPPLPDDSQYCQWGVSPDCLPPDIVVETGNVTGNGGDGLVDLVEALEMARQNPGPHHIVFAPGVTEVTVDSVPLTPVPSMTYLDGGSGVRLVARRAGVGSGLIINGTGVVVSDLLVSGFDIGIAVGDGARDVHLLRLQVGEPQGGNDIGISIGTARRVFIGRGRELECIERLHLEVPPGAVDNPQNRLKEQYDVNLVVANNGDGIVADGTEELYIYGTWVGFHNQEDGGHGDLRWGNGGVGINLKEVTGAVVGAQRIDPEELDVAQQFDPLPAFVAVGRSGQGGVLVDGGGDISMPGLILGDTPVMAPYDENQRFNLLVRYNDGPVFYGPHPLADGPEALYYGLIYSEHTIPVHILQNRDLVWIRGVQNECFDSMHGCAAPGVKIQNPAGPVRLQHVTFVYDFKIAGIFLEGLPTQDFSLELANNLFFKLDQGTVPVLNSSMTTLTMVTLAGNMKYHWGDWCSGQCDGLAVDSSNVNRETFACESAQAIPLSPDCPNVDAGKPIMVQDPESGLSRAMNLTGIKGFYHWGCGPDIGTFECTTPVCRNVPCD